jgi:hypothetical protein
METITINVIASQRVGAKRRPMINSAKQSIAPQARKLDCFVASAPRNDGVESGVESNALA